MGGALGGEELGIEGGLFLGSSTATAAAAIARATEPMMTVRRQVAGRKSGAGMPGRGMICEVTPRLLGSGRARFPEPLLPGRLVQVLEAPDLPEARSGNAMSMGGSDSCMSSARRAARCH